MKKNHEFLNSYAINQSFDYGEFLENGTASDCIIVLPDGKKVSAHRTILCQSSTFLFNAFTSGMQEDSKREVSIRFDPGGQFINLLKYFYTGEIQINEQNVLQLIEITHFYGVHNLYCFLVNVYLNEILSPSNIFEYVDKCFDMELNESLRTLEPHLARYYCNIPLSIFSEKLDISTFCHVLSLAIQNGSFSGDVIAELNLFMNGAIPDEKQEESLNSLVFSFGRNSSQKPCWGRSDKRKSH